MLSFILKKLLYGLLVVAGVTMVVFYLFMILPGNPATLLAGQKSNAATLEAINKELGLDKPKSTQFLLYINDISPISIHESTMESQEKYEYIKLFSVGSGNVLAIKKPYLRRSYQSQKLVTEIIGEAFPKTFILSVFAFIIAAFLGILFGVVSAINRHTIYENLILLIAILGISVPSFFAAVLIAWLFGYQWGEFTGLPMFGSLYDIDPIHGKVLQLKNVILPAIALGIRPLAVITQLTRSSMLEVNSMDFVRTATAKGLTKKAVILKHVLRNSLNPVLTAVSGWFASLLAGAFFVEYIFNWRGLGKVTVDALTSADFPVVMGTVLFISLIFVVVNIMVDILYAFLDPRVKLVN
ncbi:MAG: ABC transporter permease [Bacteroidetes bacterium]|nr:ABC transporter permease [Bacteroidota bacterium]